MDLPKLREFIAALKVKVDAIPLSGEQKAELAAEIGTIETQLASPKPKAGVLRESLHSIRNILEGIAGSMIAGELLKLLGLVLASFNPS